MEIGAINHCDIRGAMHLADRIKKYWAEKGFVVHTKLVKYKDCHGYGIYKKEYIVEHAEMIPYGIWGINSDMVNGFPRGKKWVK